MLSCEDISLINSIIFNIKDLIEMENVYRIYFLESQVLNKNNYLFENFVELLEYVENGFNS